MASSDSPLRSRSPSVAASRPSASAAASRNGGGPGGGRCASKPERALAALQQQESVLEELVTKHSENLRAKFAGDTSKARQAALDAVSPALERNRALQAQIADVTSTPASQRLTAIRDAREALTVGAAPKSLPEQMLGGAAFSMATKAIGALPIPGASLLAPIMGAKAAALVGEGGHGPSLR